MTQKQLAVKNNKFNIDGAKDKTIYYLIIKK